MLTVKTQSCLSSFCVSIVILFFVLDKCDFSFWNPSWLPRLLSQLILLIMSHFSLHSYAESAFSILQSLAMFFSRLFTAAFTLHPLSRSHSTVPTLIIPLFSFQINDSKPLPILPIMLWRNSLHAFMQYPLIFSSNPSLKHSHARNLLVPCDRSLLRRAVQPLAVTLLSFAWDEDSPSSGL